MGGSTALKLAFEIPDSIDKIILLSPAGLFGESKSIPSSQSNWSIICIASSSKKSV